MARGCILGADDQFACLASIQRRLAADGCGFDAASGSIQTYNLLGTIRHRSVSFLSQGYHTNPLQWWRICCSRLKSYEEIVSPADVVTEADWVKLSVQGVENLRAAT
jgi:hypothetical protein